MEALPEWFLYLLCITVAVLALWASSRGAVSVKFAIGLVLISMFPILLMRGADTDQHYVHLAYRVAAILAFLVGFTSLLLGVTASISRAR